MNNTKKIELTIPTTLADIPLYKFQKLQEVIKDCTDEVIISTKLISILCDIPESVALGLNKNDYKSISQQLINILNSQSKWVQRFKIDNVEYGFIPNLDDMSFGEYVDLDTFIKNPDDMHKVMTILYRPIIVDVFGKYRIAEYTGKEDYDIMKHASMNAVNGAMVFFYHLGNELLNHIPNYLETEVNKAIQSKQISESAGAGIVQSTNLLMETLDSLMKQQNTIYTKL